MIETVVAACAAGAFGALAYGYRGQRDQEREQVMYLRKQLETRTNPPPVPAVQPGRTNVPALVER